MKKGLFLGLVIGSITAGVTALLATPKTGKEMRLNVQEKYQDVRVKAQEKIAEIQAAKAKDVSEVISEAETAEVEVSEEQTEKTA